MWDPYVGNQGGSVIWVGGLNMWYLDGSGCRKLQGLDVAIRHRIGICAQCGKWWWVCLVSVVVVVLCSITCVVCIVDK